MKVFFCLAAILLAGASASSPPRFAASPKIDFAQISPAAKEFHNIVENFESWTPRKQVENINDMVDVVIAEIGHFLRKYGVDPMKLPNIDESIDLLGTEIILKLTNGVVHNASQIYRDGDVSLNYENRQLYLEVPVFFKIFTLNYDYSMKIGEVMEGKLIGEMVLVDVKWAVNVDFIEKKISLKYVNITNMGALNVVFDGDIADWILEIVTEVVSNDMKDQIRQLVEMIVTFAMESIFDIINDVISQITP